MFSTNLCLALTRRVIPVLASVLVMGGCASGPKNFELKATADAVINRDASGRPLSVVVHIYQLKESGEFSKLTFDTLAHGRPVSELLGKDLLEMNEVMLVPGSTETRTDKIHPDARHVGIVAFFRQPDPHYWRVLADAEQVRSNGVHIRVQDCFLALASPKPSIIPGQPPAPPLSCAGSDIRPAPVAATTVGAARTANPPPQAKRNGGLDTAKQAAESLLSKKP